VPPAAPDPAVQRAAGAGETESVRRVLALVAVAAAVAVGGCSTGTDAVDQSAGGEFRFVAGTGAGQTIPAADRRAAPDVRGPLIGGGELDVASLRGKVVVLNFWASWCGPCRVESPILDIVYRDAQARGVQFVGIGVKDDEQPLREFMTEQKISYPSLFDPNGKVTLRFRDFPPAGLPYTILLDKQGRVAAVYLTPLLRKDQIEPAVLGLAAES
jgi:thiol-disulfide isomerase/thioredoxin